MAPPGDENLQPRTGDELEVAFCILLHFILGGRIKLFKLKLSQQQQNQQQEQMQYLQQQLNQPNQQQVQINGHEQHQQEQRQQEQLPQQELNSQQEQLPQLEQLPQQEQLPPPDQPEQRQNERTWIIKMIKHSQDRINLADFATNSILVIWMVFLGVAIEKMKTISTEGVNSELGGFLLFLFLFSASSVSGFLIFGVYFMRHQNLKRRIIKELKLNYITPIE